MKNKLLILLISLSLYSCGSVIPIFNEVNLSQIQSNFPNFTKNDFLSARNSFISRCSGCHSLPALYLHTKKEWEDLLPEMLAESKASEDEKILITKYVLSFSK